MKEIHWGAVSLREPFTGLCVVDLNLVVMFWAMGDEHPAIRTCQIQIGYSYTCA
jgi:hypothetical protein